MSVDSGILVFLDGDNIFFWVGIIEGAFGTCYENFKYKLLLIFVNDYLFKVLMVKFEILCFYLNVD